MRHQLLGLISAFCLIFSINLLAQTPDITTLLEQYNDSKTEANANQVVSAYINMAQYEAGEAFVRELTDPVLTEGLFVSISRLYTLSKNFSDLLVFGLDRYARTKDAHSINNVVTVYNSLQQYVNLINFVKQVYEETSSFTHFNNMIASYVALGTTNDAIDYMLSIYDSNAPERLVVGRSLIVAYRLAQRHTDCITFWETKLTVDVSDADYLQNSTAAPIILSYDELGQVDKAVALASAATVKYPKVAGHFTTWITLIVKHDLPYSEVIDLMIAKNRSQSVVATCASSNLVFSPAQYLSTIPQITSWTAHVLNSMATLFHRLDWGSMTTEEAVAFCDGALLRIPVTQESAPLIVMVKDKKDVLLGNVEVTPAPVEE